MTRKVCVFTEMNKDERLIDEAISEAIKSKERKCEQLGDVLEEFDIPKPNEIEDEILRLGMEIDMLKVLSIRRHRIGLTELSKGDR